MRVQFRKWACETQWSHYGTGENALVLNLLADGSAVTTATVNLEDWGVSHAGAEEVWIKTWGGHEEIVEALETAGVIETPTREVFGGFADSCRAVLAKLTPDALAELEATYASAPPSAAAHRQRARKDWL